MIEMKNLCKSYDGTPAVDSIDLRVETGQFCALIGPSGCGKRTTLRMINRLIDPDTGSIHIDGKDVTSLNPVDLRRNMGYVIQNVGLFPHLTVARNISVVPELLGWDKVRISLRVKELLELLDLPSDIAERYPSSLSGGQSQRVGVARALCADPPVLLMDEPFGAVDPITREKLQNEFMHLQAALKKTIIMVTHDMDEAVRMADAIAVMKDGKIVQYGSVDDILDRPGGRFVREFVGRDAAIKKLSRLPVSAWMNPVNPVFLDDSIPCMQEGCRSGDWNWVVDAGGRLAGWIDPESADIPVSRGLEVPVSDWYVPIRPADGIDSGASLKEALSRMMGYASRRLPVVNKSLQLLGEIRFEDVERALDAGFPTLHAGTQ